MSRVQLALNVNDIDEAVAFYTTPCRASSRPRSVAVAAEHNLLHALPRLTGALVHADPQPQPGADHHAMLAPHR